MLPPFSPQRSGRRLTTRGDRDRGVLVSLDEHERAILVQLLVQLDDFLDDGRPGTDDPLAELTGMSGLDVVWAPEDPALARLLPDGNRDDPGLAEEYRRLTEFGLRSRKRSAARTAAAALRRPEPVVLASEEALSLLKAMTDVRLVLGERLELRTDEDADALHDRLRRLSGEDAEEWRTTAAIYEVLTMWQEYLVAAVSKGSG